MTFLDQLCQAQQQNQSMLCIGLDPDPARFPGLMANRPEAIFDFCAQVVQATAHLVLAFKPQIAYFSANRAEAQLEQLIAYIHQIAPGIPVILDAKRGDIGPTCVQYAKEAFERYDADAVTIAPYMGFDSVAPYLTYPHKGIFVLCRTSNPSGDDLQGLTLRDGPHQPAIYEHIAQLVTGPWHEKSQAQAGQLGLVVGATRPQDVARVRQLAPLAPLLIPGIGAQGGDLEKTIEAAWHPQGPTLINASRSILYAWTHDTSVHACTDAAETLRQALNAAKDRLKNKQSSQQKDEEATP
jgi:orotidine-5'-phosphate decarboxylase